MADHLRIGMMACGFVGATALPGNNLRERTLIALQSERAETPAFQAVS